MCRRSRLHYHLATIGYRALRSEARSPMPAGLLGDSLSFGAATRYELPSHTTSRQDRHSDLNRNDDSCNCFSLMVTSDRSHKGLSPSITAPCPAHFQSLRSFQGICAANYLNRYPFPNQTFHTVWYRKMEHSDIVSGHVQFASAGAN